MIEVVIGIAVVVVLAISLITTTLITQRTATSAKNNSQATKLAQKTIEEIRITRDRKGFSDIPLSGCSKLTSSGTDWFLSPLDCFDVDTISQDSLDFSRKIQFTGSGNEVNITVTIAWTEPGGLQSVVHNTKITNWCSGQITPGSPCPTP